MSVPFHKRCDMADVNDNTGARMYTFLLLNKRFCYFRTAFITTSILATITPFFLIYLSETTSRNLWKHFLQVSFSPGYDFSWFLVACHLKIIQCMTIGVRLFRISIGWFCKRVCWFWFKLVCFIFKHVFVSFKAVRFA